MGIKIDHKIIGYEVVKPEEPTDTGKDAGQPQKERVTAKIIHMTERVARPEGLDALEGATYKIKTPLDDHAMYVTINDIVLNPGTEHFESTFNV